MNTEAAESGFSKLPRSSFTTGNTSSFTALGLVRSMVMVASTMRNFSCPSTNPINSPHDRDG